MTVDDSDDLTAVDLTFARSFDEMGDFWRWLGERHANDAIAVDCETTGFDPRAKDAAIRLIQFGDTRQGWAIPAQDWPGLVREVLQKYDGTFVLHHARFDCDWIRTHLGFEFPRERTVDTMLAARLLDPMMPAGLKPLSARLIDPRAAAGEAALKEGMDKHGWTWATVPFDFEPYSTYSALDVVLTARIWDRFAPAVASDPCFDLEMSVAFICMAMEWRGMRIDVDYTREKMNALVDYADSIDEWARREFGLNLTSTRALGEALLESGAPLTERTATGQLKVDKKVLDALAAADDVPERAKLLITQAIAKRESRKTASSYFGAFLDSHRDGVVHPTINTMAARTHRMSINSPPLQQLPRGGALVRGAFLPWEDEHRIISCDFDQIEFRLTAELTGESSLIAAFNRVDAEGGDIFTDIGKEVYADPGFTKKDPRRGLVKSQIYGSLYGASVTKMAETAGVSYGRMKEVSDRMDIAYPALRQFMRSLDETGQLRERLEGEPYVRTPMGRRLPADPGFSYKLMNYLVQGTAGEVLKRALVRLDQSGWAQHAMIPIHDEVLFSVPPDLVEDALREIPDIMAERDHAVPLTAGAEGPFQTWGDKYK